MPVEELQGSRMNWALCREWIRPKLCLAPGDVVKLKGFKTSVELNSQHATIVDFLEGTSRWRVKLQGGQVKAVRSGNLLISVQIPPLRGMPKEYYEERDLTAKFRIAAVQIYQLAWLQSDKRQCSRSERLQMQVARSLQHMFIRDEAQLLFTIHSIRFYMKLISITQHQLQEPSPDMERIPRKHRSNQYCGNDLIHGVPILSLRASQHQQPQTDTPYCNKRGQEPVDIALHVAAEKWQQEFEAAQRQTINTQKKIKEQQHDFEMEQLKEELERGRELCSRASKR